MLNIHFHNQEIAFREAFYSINGLALIKHAIDRMNRQTVVHMQL